MEEQQDGVLVSIGLGKREKIAIVAAILAVTLVFLYFVRGILPPFIWGAVAAYVLNPAVNWISAKTRVNRGLVILGIGLVVFFGLGWGFYHVTGIVRSEMRDLSGNWPNILESASRNAFGDAPLSIFGFSISAKTMSDSLAGSLGEFPGNAVSIAKHTIETVGNLLIFFVTMFLLVLDGGKLVAHIKRVTPPPYRSELIVLGKRVNGTLGAYIRGQIFLFALMSVVTYVIMGPVLQLRYVVVISLATGILELFPIIGPITAGAIAVTVGLFQPNVFGWPPLVYGGVIALIYIILRHAEDYLVIPNVIGRVVHLHPLVVIFALFSGGAIAGILGMFIAVPAAATVRIVGDYVYRKLVTE